MELDANEGGDTPVKILNDLPSFNLDRTLHQGKSALQQHQGNDDTLQQITKPPSLAIPADKDQHMKIVHANHDEKHGDPISDDLPLVERLPSRNVSFQSSEVLTIPELSRLIHVKYATNPGTEKLPNWIKCNKNGATIRVTGVILHMYTRTNNGESSVPHPACSIDTEESWVVLGDALFVPNKKKSIPTPNKAQNGTSRVNSRKTGIRTGGKCRLSTSQLLSGKKRKLITVKPNHNSLLSRINTYSSTVGKKGDGKAPPSISLRAAPAYAPFGKQKTNFTSATRKRDVRMSLVQSYSSKIEEDLKQKSKRGMKMVVVNISSMQCFNGCKVGDLITIIGGVEFIGNTGVGIAAASHSKSAENELNSSTCTKDGDHNIDRGRSNNGLEKISRLLGICQSRIFQAEFDEADSKGGTISKLVPSENKSSHAKFHSPLVTFTCRYGYVDARILIVANGTDMNFFEKALKIRRSCLQ